MTGTSSTQWQLAWETHLGPADHEVVGALLARSYAATTTVFTPGHSWAGARPELRVLGWQRDELVAHAGVVRRFLRAGGHSQLVGDVGLVAVHPGHQGEGLGGALLDVVRRTLVQLAAPYGFLTCDPDLRPFYARSGWVALADTDLCSVGIDHRTEHDRRNGMLLPVLAPLDAWPAGPVERNGQEI
ncbi:GNAT family N-acetyltransferase [Actinomycetospora soli]|uniref:GNAT family N-acetyltransferase n=1 Tax=Actinomycetospora soli TaxID=2893887 RepID=UPI001E312694|nr:GNAT family N-acetyltransferase [Actinomycetospora soli]MCD2190514.1 GNAT family N-acetyltransferase [Actinomycetospora soli]